MKVESAKDSNIFADNIKNPNRWPSLRKDRDRGPGKQPTIPVEIAVFIKSDADPVEIR